MGEPIHVKPMRASGIQHLVDRAYREGKQYQWVRETLVNAIEAEATRVEFGIEWQAVEELGVYRRTIADNGIGMRPGELATFFNSWGGGGKPIGDRHGNFGIGAKSSLLPWNKHGLVVVSWHEGEGSMIWVMQDPATGEYGLRQFEAEDPGTGELELVEEVEPFGDEDGIDWEAVKPDWVEEHGTVLILLGNGPNDDTILGDPERSETDLLGIAGYLNRRIWDSANVTVKVHAPRNQDRRRWPKTERAAMTVGRDGDWINKHTIEGAKRYIVQPSKRFRGGNIAASDVVELSDGTEVEWYLWEGKRPRPAGYAAMGGYIAALYRNELYNWTTHHSTYRTFGVVEREVRARLWLIIRPAEYDENDARHGVYPEGNRSRLLIQGGPRAGDELPINDWGAEFADNMPEPIREAITKARAGAGSTISDKSWRQRLIDRFGARWRTPKLRARSLGRELMDAVQEGSTPRVRGAHHRPPKAVAKRRTRPGGTGGEPNTGSTSGSTRGTKIDAGGGLPDFRAVNNEDVGHYMLAGWAPNDGPSGTVLINVDHPILREQIGHWQAQYADHHAEAVEKEVVQVYGELAVAKVAHSEHLKPELATSDIDEKLRSDEALTMALLGYMAEDAVIGPRIGGKFGRRAA